MSEPVRQYLQDKAGQYRHITIRAPIQLLQEEAQADHIHQDRIVVLHQAGPHHHPIAADLQAEDQEAAALHQAAHLQDRHPAHQEVHLPGEGDRSN
jgi:hypothetical protein